MPNFLEETLNKPFLHREIKGKNYQYQAYNSDLNVLITNKDIENMPKDPLKKNNAIIEKLNEKIIEKAYYYLEQQEKGKEVQIFKLEASKMIIKYKDYLEVLFITGA